MLYFFREKEMPVKIGKQIKICFFVKFRGTYLERQTNKVGHAATGSVALPAVMRAGGPGRYQSFFSFFCSGQYYFS